MALQVILPGDEATIQDQARRIAKGGFKRVLDVGGFEKPLRPATHAIDIMPYAARRLDEGRGPLPERFTQETWVQQDANVTPWWQWPDNYFDFAWCCQVVEDIRDPLAVCREMQRVARAGFISTVHRDYESNAVQYDGVVGYHHHRWLVEADPDNNEIVFTFKSPILHVKPEVRSPNYPCWLLHIAWQGEFKVRERFIGGDSGQYAHLERYHRERGWK